MQHRNTAPGHLFLKPLLGVAEGRPLPARAKRFQRPARDPQDEAGTGVGALRFVRANELLGHHQWREGKSCEGMTAFTRRWNLPILNQRMARIGTEKPLPIEVNQMVRVLGYPNFRLPGNLRQEAPHFSTWLEFGHED